MNVAYVFPSQAHSGKVAALKQLSNTISIENVFYLCSDKKPKILKKDITLDIIKLKASHDLIIPIGAESLKYVCGMTGITKYNGILIENKFIPLIDPEIVNFKPQMLDEIKKAFITIHKAISGETNTEINEKTYEIITTKEAFIPWLEKFNTVANIAVDSETTGFDPRISNVIGMSFSTRPHEGIFVSADVIKLFINELQEVFNKVTCIFHNAKFDMSFLEYEFGFKFPKFEDNMLVHYCLNESVGTHGLKQLALQFTDLGDYDRELEQYKKEYCRKHKILLENFNYGMIPLEILAPYAYKDADATMQLINKFMPLVKKNPKFDSLYNTILKPTSVSLQFMENNGGPISEEHLHELKESYLIDIEECKEEIAMNPAILRFERIYNKTFNPNSTMQLRKVFFEILNLPIIKRTDTGAESTDKEVLKELNHPLAEAIIDLREKSKIYNTYLKSIEEGISFDGRLRSGFNIHGTTSGRLSSSGILNYQNIPRDNKDIKKLFKARPGFKIVQCDLKTAEVYYAAVLSNDKFLQQAFIDGLDFHSYVAHKMFKLPCKIEEVKKLFPHYRQISKAITFGIMYQSGPKTLMDTVNATATEDQMINFQEAKTFIDKYFKEAKDLKNWIDLANLEIERNQFIYSFFGRKRRLPESASPNKGVAKHAIRSGVNFLIQSVASDINLLGFNDAVNWIKENKLEKEIIPFTIVHDSVVSEVRDELVHDWKINLVNFLQTNRGLGIPNCPIGVDTEVGPSWGELSSV